MNEFCRRTILLAVISGFIIILIGAIAFMWTITSHIPAEDGLWCVILMASGFTVFLSGFLPALGMMWWDVIKGRA